jgi:hypothetical protein
VAGESWCTDEEGDAVEERQVCITETEKLCMVMDEDQKRKVTTEEVAQGPEEGSTETLWRRRKAKVRNSENRKDRRPVMANPENGYDELD